MTPFSLASTAKGRTVTAGRKVAAEGEDRWRKARSGGLRACQLSSNLIGNRWGACDRQRKDPDSAVSAGSTADRRDCGNGSFAGSLRARLATSVDLYFTGTSPIC